MIDMNSFLRVYFEGVKSWKRIRLCVGSWIFASPHTAGSLDFIQLLNGIPFKGCWRWLWVASVVGILIVPDSLANK
jgi:hypothetical protein